MATSFFSSAFFSGEFFSQAVVTVPSGGGGTPYFTPARYFTPSLPKRQKKAIDRAIDKELQLRVQIEKYQDTGADVAILDSLLERLKEIQILILRLALESEQAYTYIQMKRQEEDEDISFIMTLL
jgi:hypothetical protein